MAHELVVTVDFMNSDVLPQRCLFSGRTENIKRVEMKLEHTPAKTQLMVLLILLGGFIFMPARRIATIKVPQNNWGRAKWTWLHQAFLLPILTFPIIFCFLGLAIDPGKYLMPGLIAGLVVGVIVGIGIGYWSLVATVGVSLNAAGEVLLRFPSKHQLTFEVYQKAFQEYAEKPSVPEKKPGDEWEAKT